MYRFMLIITIFLRVALSTAMTATLAEVSGDVKIRRGLEETWQQAATGITLEEVDTILCLEGKAVLNLDNGMTFTLGSHSMLDIGDLKTITRQQLFLYFMSLKIEKLPDHSSQPPARLGKVSVVHGTGPDSNRPDDTLWKSRAKQERNGADALFENGLYANAIIKWHKIRQRYPVEPDCGEIESLIARSFEELKESGRAIDAWQRVLELTENCDNPEAAQRAETAGQHIDMLMP
ncbi:hypothetical protein GF407_04030 [candidate division KSB1 bacterium]|nr:hypothetical protein [candidate division KSB1 bacterium]